jgi:hypothetical protein
MYKRVAELVLKHTAGEISEEEIIELNNIRQNSGLNPTMFEELLDVHRLAADLKQMKTTADKPVHSLTQKQRILKFAKIAAMIIPLLLGVPQLLFQNKRVDNPLHSKNNIQALINAVHYEPAPDKNNLFVTFTESDLQYILRQLSQDPELEVVYSKEIIPITYSGEIPQSTPYDEFAQDFLKFKGYKSTFKGKKIIVHS